MRPVSELMPNFHANDGAPRETVQRVFQQLGVDPPSDYIDFLTGHDGGEGPVGDTAYLVLWSTAQLLELNAAYEVREFAPALVLFGSDGGDTAYAFDRRRANIVGVPFIGMSETSAVPIAKSFEDFVVRVSDIAQ